MFNLKSRRIMKKIFFPIAIAATLLVAGCAKENFVEPQTPQEGVTVLTANIDGTKTVLQEAEEGVSKVLWTNGDKINVNGVESPALELEEPAASAIFSFEGVLETPYKAVFPASIYKDATTVTLPAYQTYKEGTFSTTAAPMAAVSETASLTFHHLCAVLKLTVNQPAESDHNKIAYVDFYGKAGEQVSGDFTLNYETFALAGASTADADKKLRYKVEKSFKDGKLELYLVVPAQTYAQGWTVKIIDNEGHYMEASKGSEDVLVAGQAVAMPAFDFVPTGTELGVEIATAQDLVDFAVAYNAGEYANEDLLVVTLSQDIVFDAETSAAYAETKGIGVRSGDNVHYFGGFFNGNGKAIKSYTANVPLFAAVDTDGIVKDLTIDESSSFTFDATALDEMGTVVGYHKGLMENVTVNADITFSAADITSAKQIGGICARIREGQVKNSAYTGHIYVPATFSASGVKIYIGGVVGWISNADGVVSGTDFKGSLDFEGRVASTVTNDPYLMLGGIVGSNSGTVSDCEALGDKKFQTVLGDYSYDTATLANRSTLAYFTAEGGVAGVNAEDGKIQNCINRANFINFVLRTGADGTDDNKNSRYIYNGGIAGYNKGEVSVCTNYGFIFNRATPRLQKLGGVIGRNEGVVEYCLNETTGTISVGTAGSTPYSARLPYVGGVIGENTSADVSSVRNAAKLTISRIENNDNSEIRLGGVIGSNTAAIDGTSAKNISNSGEVAVTISTGNVTKGFFEGGVVGYTEASVKNVKNTGTVSHKHSDANLQKLYLSGVVGAVVSTADLVEISGCSNEGEVYFIPATAPSDKIAYTNNYIGGILAYSISNVAVSSCENKGYVHGGHSTRLDSQTLYVGGVVGYLMGQSSIASCTNSGKVLNNHSNNKKGKTNSLCSGGIAGYTDGTAVNHILITDCTVTTSDDGTFGHRRGYVGGIVGSACYTDVTRCTNDRNFTGSAYYIGGIAGMFQKGTMSNCEWTGTSISSSQIHNGAGGGIVARLEDTGIIDGCKSYATSLTHNSGTVSNFGLLAGTSVEGTIIKNCHYKAGQTLGVCSDSNFTTPEGEDNVADL